MQRGLDGRRIAVVISPDDNATQRRAAVVTRALEAAGAKIQMLTSGQGADADLHGARYAALVLIGDDGAAFNADPRLLQLTRECLASDKPVVAHGGGLSLVLEAGGATGRAVAANASLKSMLESAGAKTVDGAMHVDGTLISATGSVDVAEFAVRVVRELTECLDDRALDDVSDQSFPASDPPANTPATGSHAPESRA